MSLLLPYNFLQVYSWIWVSVLSGLYVFFTFSYGGAAMMLTLTKNDVDRTILLKNVVNKWWLSFIVMALITFFSAAAFPRFSDILSAGAFPLIQIRLTFIIICAISCEILIRVVTINKVVKTILTFLLEISGWVVPIVSSMTIISIFTGIGYHFAPSGAVWEGTTDEIYMINDPRTWLFAATWTVLSQTSALMCLNLKEWDYQFHQHIVKHLRIAFPIVIVLFIAMCISLLISSGYNIMPDGTATYTPTKYIENIINMPILSITLLIGFFLFFLGLILALFNSLSHAVFYYATGIILVTISLFMLAGFNNTSFVPSTTHPECSLTIYNSSADQTTLQYLFFASIAIIIITIIASTIHIIRHRKLTIEN